MRMLLIFTVLTLLFCVSFEVLALDITAGGRFAMIQGEDFLPLWGPLLEIRVFQPFRLRGSFSWGPAIDEGTFRLGGKVIWDIRPQASINPFLGLGVSRLTHWTSQNTFFDLIAGVTISITDSLSLSGEFLYNHRIIHLFGSLGLGFSLGYSF